MTTMSIFNNLGRLIQQQVIEQTASKATLDISSLSSGQYSVQFQTAAITTSTLLIIR